MLKSCIFFLCFLFSYSSWAGFNIFLKGFRGSTLTEPRDVFVYVPPGYNKSNESYPVLYMHDGQNLYDPDRGYLGQTWNAERTLDELISKRLIRPVIVVGIDNTKYRTDEYTFDRRGDDYLELVISEIRPRIERKFRVARGRSNRALMGSSLGGLISIYGGISRSQYFGLVGALSPSLWWSDKYIFEIALRSKTMPLKMYTDSGTTGGEEPGNVLEFQEILQSRGMVDNHSLLTIIQNGADHSEKYWAQRFPVALKFLFPPN